MVAPAADVDALRMLRAVIERGSIRSAALELGRTQQAVSARMRALEAAVGTPLLVRGPHGVAASEAGSLLASWAAEVLEAADRLEAAIGTLVGVGEAPLTVGASQTNAENLLPNWLVRLRQLEQEAGLQPTSPTLRVGNSTEVIQLVRTGGVEVGFIETSRLPTDLTCDWLGDDELVTVVAPGHPWASRSKPIALAELARTPLVLREEGSGTRDAFADILAAQVPPLQQVARAEVSTTAAVRSAIIAGVAPGVLSRLAVRDDLVLGRLVTVVVDAPPFIRPLTAVHARGRKLPDRAERLISVAREQLQQRQH